MNRDDNDMDGPPQPKRSRAVEPPRLLQGGYLPGIPQEAAATTEHTASGVVVEGSSPDTLNLSDPGNWTIVRLPLTSLPTLKFEHSMCRATGQREGETLWIVRSDNRPDIGLVFRWAAVVAPDLVMPVDMARMSSNLLLLDEGGQPVSACMHLAYLAQIVYSLPWQPYALNLLNRHPRGERLLCGASLPPPSALTAGETECLFWCASGKTIDDTAEIMALSPWTVKRYLTSAREKLSCVSLPQAVCRAMDTGWLAQGMAEAAERRDL